MGLAVMAHNTSALAGDNLKKILGSWRLKPIAVRGGIGLAGRPERALSRKVIETEKGLFILEEVPEAWGRTDIFTGNLDIDAGAGYGGALWMVARMDLASGARSS